MTLILSVDPGLTGALAILRRLPDHSIRLLAVHDMPTATAKVNGKAKPHILLPVLATYFQNPIHSYDAVVIEDVNAMPGQGVTSMFRFGQTKGMVEGIAAALRLPTHYMRTNEWQAFSGTKKGSDDAGRLRAVQLFPEKSDLFARKADHNRADAALIGYAFLRKLA